MASQRPPLTVVTARIWRLLPRFDGVRTIVPMSVPRQAVVSPDAGPSSPGGPTKICVLSILSHGRSVVTATVICVGDRHEEKIAVAIILPDTLAHSPLRSNTSRR